MLKTKTYAHWLRSSHLGLVSSSSLPFPCVFCSTVVFRGSNAFLWNTLEGSAWGHVGVSALTAVHPEQLVCGGHTVAAATDHSLHSCMRCPLMQWQHRWPVHHHDHAWFRVCRLRGSLSYAVDLNETSITWHVTSEKKQPAGPTVLAGQEALQRQRGPSGFFLFRHFSSVL